ncbi:hypothetical protein [Streptomyces sp. BH105]|uniref:hypothetical protein n=1 Tax=Streptomyces sp. BH105 TaxID=3410408 RepID=UPI003CEEDAF2
MTTTYHQFVPGLESRWLYWEMLQEEHAQGRLDLGVNGGRNGLLYLSAILGYLNNKSGRTFVADTTIAKRLGFESRNHKFAEVRKLAEEQGLLKVHGKKGRAWEVSLGVPEMLHSEYTDLAMCVRSVGSMTQAEHFNSDVHPTECTNSVLSNSGTQDPEGPDSILSNSLDTQPEKPAETGASESSSTDLASPPPTEGREYRPSASLASPVSSALRSEPPGSGVTVSNCSCTYDRLGWWKCDNDPFDPCPCPCRHRR